MIDKTPHTTIDAASTQDAMSQEALINAILIGVESDLVAKRQVVAEYNFKAGFGVPKDFTHKAQELYSAEVLHGIVNACLVGRGGRKPDIETFSKIVLHELGNRQGNVLLRAMVDYTTQDYQLLSTIKDSAATSVNACAEKPLKELGGTDGVRRDLLHSIVTGGKTYVATKVVGGSVGEYTKNWTSSDKNGVRRSDDVERNDGADRVATVFGGAAMLVDYARNRYSKSDYKMLGYQFSSPLLTSPELVKNIQSLVESSELYRHIERDAYQKYVRGDNGSNATVTR